MKPKKKTKPALWTSTFPQQRQRLNPGASKAGGIRARSASEEQRMAVYRGIKHLFLRANQYCGVHEIINPSVLPHSQAVAATEVHHSRGRAGNLLFDIRFWFATCAECHRRIHDNVEAARKLGLLCKEGDWNNGA